MPWPRQDFHGALKIIFILRVPVFGSTEGQPAVAIGVQVNLIRGGTALLGFQIDDEGIATFLYRDLPDLVQGRPLVSADLLKMGGESVVFPRHHGAVFHIAQFAGLVPEIDRLVAKGGPGPGRKNRVLVHVPDRKRIGQDFSRGRKQRVNKSAARIDRIHPRRRRNNCGMIAENRLFPNRYFQAAGKVFHPDLGMKTRIEDRAAGQDKTKGSKAGVYAFHPTRISASSGRFQE